MKKLILLLLVVSILSSIANADMENFAEAEKLIKSKVSCNDLTDNQLEIIGDYFMEQMHPGELHEIMDERMGGESSASLKQIHINMAKSFYCGEYGIMSAGMMNMMMGRSGFGMMNGINFGGNDMMNGYYSGYGIFGMGFFGWVFMLLAIAALVLFIIWLYKQIQKK